MNSENIKGKRVLRGEPLTSRVRMRVGHPRVLASLELSRQTAAGREQVIT